MEKHIELTCENCGDVFSRRLTEHKRNTRVGRRIFCSRSCWGKQHIPEPHPENLRIGGKLDNLSPFRYFVKVMSRREHDLTLEYMSSLWASQGGLCAVTGIPMVLPTGTAGFTENDPYNASVDRIDSDLGYIEGNVRYTVRMFNLARHRWTDEQVLEFCSRATHLGFMKD